MEDLISVIIPVYNVEKYLEKCVDSVLNQTYRNIEILLIDDGSLDNSGKICDEYAKKDNRVKVVHKKNGGLSDARNTGVINSNGKYLTFIDSDDYVSENYVSYLYKNILKYDADVSIGNIKLIFREKKVKDVQKDCVIVSSKIELLEKMLYGGPYYISACSKLYKSELFDEVRFPVGKIHEDVWTIYKIYDQCNKIVGGGKNVYNYVIRNNSITNSSFSSKDNDLITATDAMCDYLSKYSNLENAINRRRVYSRISLLCKKNVPKEIICEKVKYIKENEKKMLKSAASKRDKIATKLICINIDLFYFVWGIYCKLTNRIR